jgi:ABC-type phosphate transport system auxiliary subunit
MPKPEEIEEKVKEKDIRIGQRPDYGQITEDLIEHVRNGDKVLMKTMKPEDIMYYA